MKKNWVAFAWILSAALSGLSQAAVLITFTPTTPVTIAPGGFVTFNVSLTINGGESVAGVDYYILAPAANEFTLTAFDNSSSTFNLLGPSNPNNTPLNPATIDLGASPASPVGNGTYFLSQITLQAVGSLEAGAYHLTQSLNSDWIDGSFAAHAFSAPAPSLDITVQAVPEPATGAMLLLGMTALGAWAFGRGRKQAPACGMAAR